MTDKEIRDLIRSEIKSHMLDMPNKAKVKEIAKEVSNEYLTKKEVKDMIKDTMNAYHRWMWEKKNMWMSQI
jgi:hypothetical protein